MANTLISVLKKSVSMHFFGPSNNLGVLGLASIYAQDIRHLFVKTAIGLDTFELQREKVKSQMANVTDKFKEKMAENVISDSQHMIFTEDLKNMVHLADNDKDVGLSIEMLKKYNKQNKSLRFGNYIFGPVIMRMLYIHNKVDLALESFKSLELSGIFDQFISYQLLLDLLYENQRYKDILDVFEIIKERQLEGQMYPRNSIVLLLAACYKMNNQEALDYALKLWKELNEVGHVPMRRAATFCACLALNQGKPDIALEILQSAKNQNYTTVRNLKVACLAEIGRTEDIIPIFKGVLNEDTIPAQKPANTFNRDVLERVKKALEMTDNAELTVEYSRLVQQLEKLGHITDVPLDIHLCSEIQRPPLNRNQGYRPQEPNFQYRDQNRNFNRNYQPRRQPENQRGRPQRHGLTDLV